MQRRFYVLKRLVLSVTAAAVAWCCWWHWWQRLQQVTQGHSFSQGAYNPMETAGSVSEQTKYWASAVVIFLIDLIAKTDISSLFSNRVWKKLHYFATNQPVCICDCHCRYCDLLYSTKKKVQEHHKHSTFCRWRILRSAYNTGPR